MTPEMTPEERNAWAAYDGHRIDRAELKAVLVAEAMAAVPYNRPCDCGSGLMVRICSLCLERARSAAVAEEREACAQMVIDWGSGDDDGLTPAAFDAKHGSHKSLPAAIRARP